MGIGFFNGSSRCVTLLAVCGFMAQSAPALAQQNVPTQQPAPITAPAVDDKHANIWLGTDITDDSAVVFGGTTVALDGNLYDTGPLLRGTVAFGKYDTGIPTNSRAAFSSAAILVGYQGHVGNVFVAGFVGPELVHNGEGASPDIRGTSVEGRVTGEIAVPLQSFVLSSWASYSTFQDQYYVQGRLAYFATPSFLIGPQVSYSGGDGWNRGRIGGQAAWRLPAGEIALGVGHAWNPDGSNGDGLYGNVSFTFAF